MQKYPSHLYIRVDRDLRTDLAAAAKAAGLTVSEMGRAVLRNGLSDQAGSRAERHEKRAD